MELRILGPLEACNGDRLLDLGGPKPRALLAILLLRAGGVVSDDRLIDELWGEAPPRSARHLLHVYVSSLRRVLEPGVLVTRAPGYALELGDDAVDAWWFERALADGRRLLAAGDPEAAAATLRDACALWRGPALADFVYEPFAQADIARLEELRVVAVEERIEAELALGRHDELVSELGALVSAEPLRERPRGQLMLALYRAGRQADALEVYREGRELLVEELGIEPGPSLAHLQQAILRHDPSLEPARISSPATPGGAVRKLVTVAVARAADGPGDPEARRATVAQGLEAVSAVLARHGATVRPALGESVMGVFGVPETHEDDALRATRAASEARTAACAPAVGIEAGEVLVDGDAVEGDTVARAVRLSQAAGSGEVLLGETAHRLVRHAILCEDGTQPGERRLVAVVPEAPAFPARLDAPLVGRDTELSRLRDALAGAVRDARPQLVTVIGDAGVGKSRLARELMAAPGVETTTLVGRCPAYGEGITFWPLREMVRQAAGGDTRDALVSLLAGDDERDDVARLVLAALGAGGGAATRQETFRAFRRLLLAAAGARPLLLVFEDVHWGEPTFLDLVEFLAGSRDAGPVLVLCLARPELLERRLDWPDRAPLELAPLHQADARSLVEGAARLPREAADRIVAVGEGNPFFLEQMVALLAGGERAQDELSLPLTVRALLTARLDRLGPAEREVLERGSVLGREFEPEAVAALLSEPARPSVRRHLEALVRKQLLRAPGSAFRFSHVLIQEAAYRTVPKALRAELHEQAASRLGESADDADELIGYHLERAWRYHDELGRSGPPEQALAARAADRLWAAARRAAARMDVPAALNLYDRAASLLPEEPTGALLQELGATLNRAFKQERADAVLMQAIDRARRSGDTLVELRALLDRWWSQSAGDPTASGDRMAHEVEDLIARLEPLEDDLALTKAWQLLAHRESSRGRLGVMQRQLERALVHAHRSQDPLEVSETIIHLHYSLYRGPLPAAEGIARCDAALDDGAGGRLGDAAALATGGVLRAMRGDFDGARARLERSRAIYEDLAFSGYVPWLELWHVEMLAGDPRAAERWMQAAGAAVPASLPGLRFLHVAALAHALCAQERYEDAARLTARSDGPTGLVRRQILWRSARAKALARCGDPDEAVRLAREAVALAEPMDDLNTRADALFDLAETVRLRDGAAAAQPHLADAVALYERKGNAVMAARASALRHR